MKILNIELLQMESQNILCNFYKNFWHKDMTIWRYVDKEEVWWVTQNQNSTKRKSREDHACMVHPVLSEDGFHLILETLCKLFCNLL